MSAAEHEAVEVDVSPSDFVDAESVEGVEEAATTASTSRRGFMTMLTSTSPSESPEAQDGTLSTRAAWYQHLELAVKKATGSSGTPAWVNLVMSCLLLAAESAGLEIGQSSSREASATGTEGQQSAGPDLADNGETSVVTN